MVSWFYGHISMYLRLSNEFYDDIYPSSATEKPCRELNTKPYWDSYHQIDLFILYMQI